MKLSGAGSKQEIPLGHRHDLGWLAGQQLPIGAHFVGFRIDLDFRSCVVENERRLGNPSSRIADGKHLFSGDLYEIGDTVVYRVPDDASGAGTRVYHRVVDRLGEQLVFRGDNNSSPDPWRLGSEDVIGREVLRVPNLGWLLHYAGQPAVIAAIAAGVAAAWATSRTLDDEECSATHCGAGAQA